MTLACLGSLATAACDRAATDTTPPPAAAPPEPTQAPRRIDAEAMRADLDFLADDELAGRHTFSPELERAATYLAERYADAGLEPFIGDRFEVPFSLYTGAKSTGESALTVLRPGGKGKPREVPADAFTPLADGAAGKVRAPAVFVGYAAQADPVSAQASDGGEAGDDDDHDQAPAGEATPNVKRSGRSLSTSVDKPSERPGFDSFAGVDLKGKIAVVLLDLPGQPDLRAFFEKMQAIAAEYNEQAKPLVEQGDDGADALAKLHRAKLEELAGLVRPFLRGQPLPESFFETPETYGADLDLQRRLAPLTAMAADLPGPRFDPRQGFTSRKLARLAEAGVAGVVFVRGPNTMFGDPDQVALPPLDDKGSFGAPYPFPVVQMHWKAADRVFKVGGKKLSKVQDAIDADFTPRSGSLDLEIEIDAQIEPIAREVPNLAGVLRGSERPDEYVVVGAHFDHIGKAGDGHDMCRAVERREETDEICNGADDNASGSASILAIARALKAEAEAGRGPRRSVVFTHFAGEELGLWGSKALAERPEFDAASVAAMVNLDMVGRLGRKGLAIGGINSSPIWMPLLDELGAHGMKVLYEGAVAGRSDHASFYTKGIPVLFLFTGTHADYHRAGDDPDEVNFEGMAEITELGLEIVERAADGREIPFVPPTEGDGIASSLPGQNPETVIKTVEAAP